MTPGYLTSEALRQNPNSEVKTTFETSFGPEIELVAVFSNQTFKVLILGMGAREFSFAFNNDEEYDNYISKLYNSYDLYLDAENMFLKTIETE